MSLDPKQLKGLNALISGKSESEAGAIAGVSRATVARWKRKAEFRDALAKAKSRLQSDIRDAADQSAEEARARLDRLSGLSFQVLEEILISGEESTRNKLAAISIIGKWAGLEARHNKKKKASIKFK